MSTMFSGSSGTSNESVSDFSPLLLQLISVDFEHAYKSARGARVYARVHVDVRVCTAHACTIPVEAGSLKACRALNQHIQNHTLLI